MGQLPWFSVGSVLSSTSDFRWVSPRSLSLPSSLSLGGCPLSERDHSLLELITKTLRVKGIVLFICKAADMIPTSQSSALHSALLCLSCRNPSKGHNLSSPFALLSPGCLLVLLLHHDPLSGAHIFSSLFRVSCCCCYCFLCHAVWHVGS